MGDKQSVEARNFQPDADDCSPCHCVPENLPYVRTTADIASTSPQTGSLLTNFHDTGGTLLPIQSDAAVNGVGHCSPDSPPLSAYVVSSPKRKMKQSKSANHNMNGDTSAVACQDAKRSFSVDAKLVDADGQHAGTSVVDNCVSSGQHSAASAAATATAAAEDNTAHPTGEPPSPSTSSTITVLSVVHVDNEGRRQKSGR